MSQPGVTLALSSGGARGLAHIGVLKVLDRYQIPIRGIAGSSMGGLVGALYCTGYTGLMLEEVALGIRRSDWLDFSLSKMGVVAGRKLEGLLSLLTRGRRFEECQPPLKVVAVDIESATPVVIDSGSLARGVRATVSIPGIFSPVIREGRVLVDGGVLNRVPVDIARQWPGNVLVAVDVGVELATKVGSMFDVLFQTFDIMARQLRQYQQLDADIVIEPDLTLSRDAHFSQIGTIIAAGEKAAEAAMPSLLALLGTVTADANEGRAL